jgi:hypothetical protein
MRKISLLLLASIAIAASAHATPEQAQLVDLATARVSLNGQWEGTLEYLDYSANRWFGIPVKTQIEDQGDKATTIRRSDFDDGPTTGNVRITSVELFDAASGTVTTGTFRKGRTVEVYTHTLRMEGTAKDATHWTMIEEVLGKDDNRAALLRYTTTRDGDKIETIKTVDFQDDMAAEWITRNRTRLTRVGD